MFDGKRYKKIAKLQLKNRRSATVLASLVVLALFYILIVPGRNVLDDSGVLYKFKYLILLAWAFVWGATAIAYSYLFIALSHTTEEQPFARFVQGFTRWLDGTLAFLWCRLWITLWTCLLVVPGIVKSYAYSQIYFILAEHPNVGVRKAMNMSKVMTNGHKADLFMLDLSFLGWLILCMMTGGLLFLRVGPYYMMTKTNAYHCLKDEAIRSGKLCEEDFLEA
ncbi:MAG: DUF975 family protein [Treponema sp.]|nr:DUF975 family protein [Treponema sp.]